MSCCCCLILIVIMGAAFLSIQRHKLLRNSTLIDSGRPMGCYKCQSGGLLPPDQLCESGTMYPEYQSSCFPPGIDSLRKRIATSCVKVVGADEYGNSIVMRGCSVSIKSQCKDYIPFNGQVVKGCIYSCNDREFCNSTYHLPVPNTLFMICLILLINYLENRL